MFRIDCVQRQRFIRQSVKCESAASWKVLERKRETERGREGGGGRERGREKKKHSRQKHRTLRTRMSEINVRDKGSE